MEFLVLSLCENYAHSLSVFLLINKMGLITLTLSTSRLSGLIKIIYVNAFYPALHTDGFLHGAAGPLGVRVPHLSVLSLFFPAPGVTGQWAHCRNQINPSG